MAAAPPDVDPRIPSSGRTGKLEDWIRDTLAGNFDTIPELEGMLSEDELDPAKNPALQNVIDSIQRESQEDYLGDLRAATEGMEGAGMMGSGFHGATKVRLGEEARESVDDAISRMLAGHYENTKNRQAGLVQAKLGQQSAAANSDVGLRHAKAAQSQASAAHAAVGVDRARFNWQKQMDIDSKQQDALNDFYNIIAGVGGMGGSEWGMGNQSGGGMDPWAAALIGGTGAGLDAYSSYKQNQNQQRD